MNEKQLTQVLDNVENATVFGPNGSHQLVPPVTLEDKAVQTKNNIIESATKLAADMIAVYQERVDGAQAKLTIVKEVAAQLVAAATKTAEEVDTLNTRDRKVGEGFTRVLEENGITFDGAI